MSEALALAIPYIYSVHEISKSLKLLIETNFAHVKIRGEIIGYKLHSSGHHYFTIKDSESSLNAVMWRGTSVKIPLSDGMEVIVTGRVTIFPSQSKYQIVVQQVEPAGEGALLKVFNERKERLKKEGLFEQKRSLPSFPKRIGVITSKTGAVLQDILHRIEERYPTHVLLWPVLVQGQGAKEQICEAILGFNRMPEKERPDVLIIARGGGSLEDLWVFNEEDIARAAFVSMIPTVSAIGHETDITLLDFVCDKRAPTPTAAAEIITPDRQILIQTVQGVHKRLELCQKKQLLSQKERLRNLMKGLPDLSKWLQNKHDRVQEQCYYLYKTMRLRLELNLQKTQQIKLSSPKNFLLHKKEKLYSLDLKLLAAYACDIKKHKLEVASLRLNFYDIQPILQRGFCLVKDDVSVIDPYDFKIGQQTAVSIQSAQGTTKFTICKK